jgi:hypothetical protein
MSMTAQPMLTACGVSRPWLRCGDGPAQPDGGVNWLAVNSAP